MTFRDHFKATIWIGRTLTGRMARRVYLAIVLTLVVASAAIRSQTYLVARKIQAVIAGLSKLQIDQTTEDELPRIVPYLVRASWDHRVTTTAEYGDVDVGVEHIYYVTFSNQRNWERFVGYAWRFWGGAISEDGRPLGLIFKVADWMGYRYTAFGARVILLNGRVSSVGYAIDDRLVFPQVMGSIVSVSSNHAYWAPHESGFEVSSTDDESPEFHVRGSDASLAVSFGPDASAELRSHAFHVDLRCFWSFGGCRNARQVAPLLWQDKNAIEAAALARLKSDDPCPDRILAGRVKYFPDLNVVLLESIGFKIENGYEQGGMRVNEMRNQFKLVENLRGRPSNFWESVASGLTVPYPGDYTRTLPNTGLRWAKPGEKVLAFPNFNFDSCRVVPATPSAISIIRDAHPSPRRAEDMIVGGIM